MKQIVIFLLLALAAPKLSHAEEITQNQAYCMSIAFASADIIHLLCVKTPRDNIITSLRTKYYAISSEIEGLVETQTNLYSEATCSQARDKIIGNIFEACYASHQSMSGR